MPRQSCKSIGSGSPSGLSAVRYRPEAKLALSSPARRWLAKSSLTFHSARLLQALVRSLADQFVCITPGSSWRWNRIELHKNGQPRFNPCYQLQLGLAAKAASAPSVVPTSAPSCTLRRNKRMTFTWVGQPLSTFDNSRDAKMVAVDSNADVVLGAGNVNVAASVLILTTYGHSTTI